jgi:ATP synthase protein I
MNEMNRENEKSEIESTKAQTAFSDEIGLKAASKLEAQSNPNRDVWFGLGMMGLIGWSVVLPTLLGAALGIWLDNHYPRSHSWTLALLVAGLALGCFNAWQWVDQQDKLMGKKQGNDDA